MKMTVNSKIFGGGKYTAPEIEMYESVVERGFQDSPWGDEGYTGNLNYGKENDADI